MQLILNPSLSKQTLSHPLLQAFYGSLFIALCSLVKIPTYPVPITLQTFALITLCFLQTPRICALSAIFYLSAATLGLPVLCGHSNPLWFLGKTGGYLFAFPLAAYLTAYLGQKSEHFLQKFCAICCGHFLIYTLGWLQLSCFIGYAAALKGGVLFFLPSTFCKDVMALSLVSYLKKNRSSQDPYA